MLLFVDQSYLNEIYAECCLIKYVNLSDRKRKWFMCAIRVHVVLLTLLGLSADIIIDSENATLLMVFRCCCFALKHAQVNHVVEHVTAGARTSAIKNSTEIPVVTSYSVSFLSDISHNLEK